jgi:hypothetical protein
MTATIAQASHIDHRVWVRKWAPRICCIQPTRETKRQRAQRGGERLARTGRQPEYGQRHQPQRARCMAGRQAVAGEGMPAHAVKQAGT